MGEKVRCHGERKENASLNMNVYEERCKLKVKVDITVSCDNHHIELTVNIFATSEALLSFFPHTVLKPSMLLFREADASDQSPSAAYLSPACGGMGRTRWGGEGRCGVEEERHLRGGVMRKDDRRK